MPQVCLKYVWVRLKRETWKESKLEVSVCQCVQCAMEKGFKIQKSWISVSTLWGPNISRFCRGGESGKEWGSAAHNLDINASEAYLYSSWFWAHLKGRLCFMCLRLYFLIFFSICDSVKFSLSVFSHFRSIVGFS